MVTIFSFVEDGSIPDIPIGTLSLKLLARETGWRLILISSTHNQTINHIVTCNPIF